MHEAVVLLGGFGTRLKSVTGEIPKPMVNVAGTPFVYKILQQLENAGFTRIILSLHYQADYIKQRILTEKPVSCEIIFVIEDYPLGTGGGVKLSANSVKGDKFVVINGDTFCDINFLALSKFSADKDLVMGGVKVNDASRYGAIEFDDNFLLTSMCEKGISGSAFINSGVYVLSKALLLKVEENCFSLEREFFPKHIKRVFVFHFEAYFIDIGIPEDYILACEHLG